MSTARPDKEAYQLLETRSPVDGSTRSFAGDDDVNKEVQDGAFEAEEQGHGDYDAATVTLPLQRPAFRSKRALVGALLFFCLSVLAGAFAHPAGRTALQSILASPNPAYVERNPSITLSEYLHARFDPSKDVVMWTMATAAYVEPTVNWAIKAKELGMNDSVVVLCLDAECLDEVEKAGMRAYGGYLPKYANLPPPTTGQPGRLSKRGAERGHFMAWTKFRVMLDMAKTGFPSLFFEGDTFLTANPFDHMLPLDDPSWDMQGTEDIGYLLNFGWLFTKPTPASVKLWELAFEQYERANEWDQQLISSLIRNQGGHEWAGPAGGQHWWLIDSFDFKLYMLPLSTMQATHTVMLNWFSPNLSAPEPVMNHLTAVTYANRRFYPKERGWFANVNGFYTRLRPIVTSPSLNGTVTELLAYSRILEIVANKTDRAFMVPDNVTIVEGGQTLVRDWTRLVNIEAAVANDLDLLEPRFFTHAARYLPTSTLDAWSSNRRELPLDDFKNIHELIAHVDSLPSTTTTGPPEILSLTGWNAARADAWSLAEVDVDVGFKIVPPCERFEEVHLPFPWCKSVFPAA
ncbi:hypothetical protein JCM1841_004305 [Sporobolomyces salmonicolor]